MNETRVRVERIPVVSGFMIEVILIVIFVPAGIALGSWPPRMTTVSTSEMQGRAATVAGTFAEEPGIMIEQVTVS